MHLIIPYAASQSLGATALQGLRLPHLKSLLAHLKSQRVERDRDTDLAHLAHWPALPHLPHERVHAHALGWDIADPLRALPWAAHAVQAHSPTQTPSTAQAWMTPCHWQVGMDQVVMADPAHLQLSDDESQQLLQAMQPFFLEDGLQVTWHNALLWHAQGTMLAGVTTASLDRVIGQNVKPWLPSSNAARPLQRLQSEMQMLLYNHPVNDARDARRRYTVNAFWLHGAGTLPESAKTPPPKEQGHVHEQLVVSEALRASALSGDLQTWRQAWQALDASAVADLLQQVKTTGQGRLSLCSEHTAQTYGVAPAAWHQRLAQWFKPVTPAAALATLITP